MADAKQGEWGTVIPDSKIADALTPCVLVRPSRVLVQT